MKPFLHWSHMSFIDLDWKIVDAVYKFRVAGCV